MNELPGGQAVLICETERLRASQFTLDDAGFILRLLNEPSFIRNIADKHVRTLDDARTYLRNGPLASYGKNGFGLWRLALQDTGEIIGICGLIRREGRPDVDIGYALLPAACGHGFAAEAVRGVLDHGARHVGLRRIVAVVNPDNAASIRVLDKAGFRFESMVVLPGETTPIRQYGRALTPCVRLTPPYAEAYRKLMLEAYATHPEAFTSSVAEREALPLSWWQQRLTTDPNAHEVIFGAFAQGALVGAVGLGQETREKARHKATLFGMFVQAGHQHAGLGRLLVEAALEHAHTRPGLRQVLLTVTEGNARAHALYTRCGFETFGVEPDAVTVGSSFVSKIHMWRRLDPGVTQVAA
ncbi:MAG: GNAT family N-acetyltransferase [Hylemonella sp.]|jgi:RimJ/RimL family protein N-acetyltransferase|nr:GNAT family N-acetyltransferase [Hylemonella sp.]